MGGATLAGDDSKMLSMETDADFRLAVLSSLGLAIAMGIKSSSAWFQAQCGG